MKFKVGDKVKVRKDLKPDKYYGGVRFDSDMRKMKGRTVTIIGAFDDDSYSVEGSIFYWTDEMFENKDYTYEDLKKSPIGTKITFENGSVLVETREGRFENYINYTDIEFLKNLKDNSYGKIIKIEEPEYTTVYERKEEILDEAEKRYLRNFIRPFRDKVKAIRKTDNNMNGKNNQYITVTYKNDLNTDFPNFKPNTMYKGMKMYKNYTLEELGL